jgi:tape measure domain-containing protein
MPKNLRIKTSFEGKDNLSRPLSRMERNLKRMGMVTNRLSKSFKKLGRNMMKVGRFAGKVLKRGFIAAGIGVGALAFGIKKLADSFSMIEDAEAAFTPLLGGAKKAKDMVQALTDTAATTPFQFETLSDTAQQLLPSMNGNIAETIRLTRMMGDTAGGSARKMESITRGFNKALLKGKVDMESLNMIAEAGVPIIAEMGRAMGKTGAEIMDAVSDGDISVQDLTRTFERMTGEGGLFFKGMEIASETLTGRISTLKDITNLAMASMGASMAPVLKDLVEKSIVIAKGLLAWADANKEVIAAKFKEYVEKTIQVAKDLYNWVVKNKEAFFTLWNVLKTVVTVGFRIVKFFVESKEAVLALVAAFATFKIMMFANQMGSLALSTASVGTSAAGSVQGLASMASKMSKMLGIVGALVVMYQALSFAADQFDRARDLRVKRDNLATSNQRNLAKQNVKQFTDSELKAKLNRQTDLQTDLSSKKANFLGFGGRTIEEDAQLEGMRGNTEKLQREIARRSAGGEREPLITNSSTTEKTEIVIKDETGRASVTKGGKSKNLELVQTGAF